MEKCTCGAEGGNPGGNSGVVLRIAQSAERWPSMQKVPGSDPSSGSDFSKNLKMALQLVCAGDSSETTTAISKAVGCNHCPWCLHTKKPHLSIVISGRKSRLSAGR